ncbi:hypothetical protein Clacol_004211 [Clathrus columnatus]|uniref:Protein kinase domain-containing protein n=1 Tax=Clathrus columnatus TaxID=1419009 RepID=A0AAV5ADI6_9AGAM|nr:hypothetical protein Clacol_004211 [Clathrus columnatus]
MSRQNRSAHMEQEAWFYDELEQVQGIAVPRCYGLFQAHIEEGAEVKTWNDEKDSESDDSDDSDQVAESDQSDGDGFAGANANESEGEKIPEMPTPDPTLLSILLLERLGERMPVGESLDHIKDDVHEIYNDLSRLGIEHLDIRWSNILSVIQDPDDESSGTVCPNHGHAHQWRVIDFDVARKTNGTIIYMDKCAGSWLVRLFLNLPKGRIIEPWD